MTRRSSRRALMWTIGLVIASIALMNIWTSLSPTFGGTGVRMVDEETTVRNVLSQSVASISSKGKSPQVDYLPSAPVDNARLQSNSKESGSMKILRSERAIKNLTTYRPENSSEYSTPTRPHERVANDLNISPIHPKGLNWVLPDVQAWPDKGDTRPPRTVPLTDRPLFQSMKDLKPVQSTLFRASTSFENSTINPVLPSCKVQSNPLTMWNVEIPLNYSDTAHVTSTIPWSNCTTLAFYEGRLRSGFRNQIMAFVALILEANHQRHGQFLLRSLGQKDTYGTNSFIPFAKLWDVAHWNSHYPRLPRLVDYDPVLHSQFNYDNGRWFRTPSFNETTTNDSTKPLPVPFVPPANWFGTYGLFASPKPRRPYGYGFQHKLMAAYAHYAKGKGKYANEESGSGHRNPAEILMLQGAMRPHPELQAIIDRLLVQASLLPPNASTAVSTAASLSQPSLQLDYMTLHARVEPDMQKHVVCRDKKVINLTDIFNFMERKWHDPPVSKIFMPINRQYLELEGDIDHQSNSSAKMSLPHNDKKKKLAAKDGINWVAVENLRALNRARDVGLWGGRAKVIEFGANALSGTSYADQPSTAGAMLNFFIGVPAKIFIGTEVSSFSHDLLATRFFRGYSGNYKYLPSGLHDWTPPGTLDPPGFTC